MDKIIEEFNCKNRNSNINLLTLCVLSISA